jgi:hypothetical protein
VVRLSRAAESKGRNLATNYILNEELIFYAQHRAENKKSINRDSKILCLLLRAAITITRPERQKIRCYATAMV